jgi:hypothetical protein
MNGDMDKLAQKRRKWVEANQENGFEEGIKRLLTELYPDNAHFIYELLQNAEDTRASKVSFTLNSTSLDFVHNGDRMFTLKDVDSITSIGVSTKRDDPTSIGKFGVGFKAVFAYSTKPEIHSGEFHFCIHDLVVPETSNVKKPKMENQDTRFTFPFDHPKKSPKLATEEIEQGLRALGDNTLLFLNHIRKIEYRLPNGSIGFLERIDHEAGHIEIRAKHPNGDAATSHWLRFQKEVDILDEDASSKICRIAIAYSLAAEEGKNKSQAIWKIVPLDEGQVSIYFPAEKERSNLHFHIDAPFASTVARDSVRNCAANNILCDHLADLTVESLTAIRDRGMLTVGFLSVLPNTTDNLPTFYEPFQMKLITAFQNEPFTPTKIGKHAPSNLLYRTPRGAAEIANVLSDADLSLLTNHAAPLWTANPPLQNQREDRFLDSLEVDKWGWSELSSALSIDDDEEQKRVEEWISQKSDTWLRRFYALLGEACDSHRECVDVSNLRIVRVTNGQGHEHVFPNEAYFPPEDEIVVPSEIRFVKPEVYRAGQSDPQKKSAISFLENVGVFSFDSGDIVALKLNRYETPPKRVSKDHYKDIRLFVDYYKKNPFAENARFQTQAFLLGSVDGKLRWLNPNKLCIDDPYLETGLAEFSSIHGKHVLWEGYKKHFKENELIDFVMFLKKIGVMHDLKIILIPVFENPHVRELRKDYYNNATQITHTAINRDYSIARINSYITTKSASASHLIWNALISADAKYSQAEYRPNRQYMTRNADSQLICHLKKNAWIPNQAGEFCKPQDMTKDDLSKDFPFDDRNGLLTAIGFGANAIISSVIHQGKNEAAKEMGFLSAEDAKQWAELSKHGISPNEILAQHKKTEQPEEIVPNPERRKKGVIERGENAPSKEKVTRERSIQPNLQPVVVEAKAYLRAKYTNIQAQLVCQCCQAEMPFKVGDAHYFEAVQCVKSNEQHHYENRLALCPTCAAMFKHARDTDDTNIRQLIMTNKAPDNSPFVEIPIMLAKQNVSLRFVGTHFFDLKIILDDKS